MAQDYTRQSTFADGDTITAALFNDEYNQLVNAFAYSSTSANTTGHRHDGTSGQGGNIPKIGDLDFLNKIEVDSTNNRWGFYVEVSSTAVEQIRIQDGAIVPVTDSDIDLGTSSLEFKDLYIDGTATIDTLTVDEAATIGTTLGVTGATTLSSTLGVTGATTLSSTLAVTGTSTLTGNVTTTNDLSVGGNLTVTGNATISGNLTFGDADTDSITLTADVASSITPDTDDTYDLGSSTKEWRNLYIDGTANIDSLVADTADINAGTIDNTTIGGTTAVAGTFTTANATTVDTTNIEVTNIKAKDGTSAGSIADTTGVVTLASSVLTTTDINGGSIDGTTIGATTASTGNFSTLSIGGVAITSTAAELNILDGVTATASEINTLDGITATTAELNYTDGVTSNIQTQLDAKQALDADLTAIAALSNTDGNFIVGNGTTWVAESGATARASLGLTIGTDVLAYDSNLQSFVTAFTVPTSDGTNGQALITDGSGTISFGDVDALPTQTGNSGYYLTTDGTNASWDNLKASPTFTGTVTISSTDALTLPVGTTAERPTAAQGMIRYNTTDSQFEGYNGSSWDAIGGGAEFAYTRTTATATASQTTFSATYTVGYVDVYLNGVKLVVGTDFTATNGTSVVLTTGATVGDSVEILAYEVFSVANALIASNNLSDLGSASTAITNLGITSTAAELNILDGVTATTTELNYLDVTTVGSTEASKAVTTDANGVVTFNDGISEKYEAVTSSSNSTTVDLQTSTNFSHTLTENTTFTFSNPASSGNVSSFTLKIVQDASASGYTVTWPTEVDWPSATAPTLTATASAVDYFVFITHDGGTTYYGFTAGQALG